MISVELLWVLGALATWFILACFHMTVFTRSRFLIKVLYKSGNSHEFWCRRFSYERQASGVASFEWEPVSREHRPVLFGADDVEATWQIEQRLNIFAFAWVNLKEVMSQLRDRFGPYKPPRR